MSTAAAPQERLERLTRVVLRPIGSPVPLGFAALAGASLVVSGLDLKWFGMSQSREVGFILLAFPVPLQIVASIFAFLGRDGAVGSSMGVLSGTWLSIALIKLFSPPASTSPALGTLLFVSGAVLLLTALVASTGKLVPALVLAAAGLRFIFSGVYQVSHATGFWQGASGVLGCVVCGLALYAILALELGDTRREEVLPTGRLGVGARSLEGNLVDQIERVQREAGVREQL